LPASATALRIAAAESGLPAFALPKPREAPEARWL